VAQAAVVVDVRTPGEFAGGHLERAINIPIDELETRLAEIDRALEGDRTKKLVVYCASGRARASRRTCSRRRATPR
jgi:phage shock protein E